MPSQPHDTQHDGGRTRAAHQHRPQPPEESPPPPVILRRQHTIDDPLELIGFIHQPLPLALYLAILLLEPLSERFQPSESSLDLGCGLLRAPVHAPGLLQAFARTHGPDSSPAHAGH